MTPGQIRQAVTQEGTKRNRQQVVFVADTAPHGYEAHLYTDVCQCCYLPECYEVDSSIPPADCPIAMGILFDLPLYQVEQITYVALERGYQPRHVKRMAELWGERNQLMRRVR